MEMMWTWLAVLSAILTMAAVLRREKDPQPLLAVVGDEDIKIAEGPFKRPAAKQDMAEQAARDFLEQKQNGNIDKAHRLGEAFALALWELAQDLIMGDHGLSQQEIHHRLLLCSYSVNRVIAELSPNTMVAQTALSRFYAKVEEYSEMLHRHVSDTAAFSLYILSGRTNGSAAEIGRIYARLAGYEGNPLKIEQGGDIYSAFYKSCSLLLDEVEYVK